jgi:hypothetical protein
MRRAEVRRISGGKGVYLKVLELLEDSMRTQLIPAKSGLNLEREGGVQHVGTKSNVAGNHQSGELLAQDVYG